MKTIFKYFKKSYESITLLLCLLFLFSCKDYSEPITFPEPQQNPLYLSSEAQTKDTWVKNLSNIGAENPETDEVYRDNHQTTTSNPSTKIKNGWIILDEGGTLPKESIRITIKENTSDKPRSYELKIYSHYKEARLLIIQKGNGDD